MLIKSGTDFIQADDLYQSGFDLKTIKAGGIVDEAEYKALDGWWDNVGSSGSGGLTNSRKAVSEGQLLAEFSNNAVVYACVNKNATKVASTPWSLYKVATNKVTKSQKKLSKKLRSRIKVNAPADTDLVEVTNHPFIDLLLKDNEDLNGYQLFKVTQEDLEIYGRAYWMIDSDDDGNDRLTSLRPYSVIPLRDVSGYVVAYNYYNYVEGWLVGGADRGGANLSKVIRIEKNQMIDFRNVSSYDRYGGGLSPLRAAIRSVLMSSQYIEWINAILSNRKRMDYIITAKAPNGLDDGQREQIENRIDQRLGGANNGKPLVIPEAVNITPMSFGPTDIAPLEISDEAKKDFYKAMGIPSALMDSDSATYSNYESALEDWQRGGIIPRLGLIEQVVNQNAWKLGAEYEGVIFAYDPIIPEDLEFQLKQEQADVLKAQALAASGVATDNEIREAFGLEPIAGGDELHKPTPAAPIATETDDSGDDDPTEPNEADNGTDDPTGPDASDPTKGFNPAVLLRINKAVRKGELSQAAAIGVVAMAYGLPEADVRHWVAAPPTETPTPTATPGAVKGSCGCGSCDPSGSPKTKALPPLNKQERKVKKVVAAHFNMLKKSALAHCIKSLADETITKADTGRLPTAFTDLQDWADNLKNTANDLAYEVQPLVEVSAKATADNKATSLIRAGASPDAFSVVPQAITEASNARAHSFAQSTMDTTRKTVRDAISQVKTAVEDSAFDGDPVDVLKDKISDIFEDAEDYQAERIARTEISAAVHSGQVIAAKASGIVSGFRYIVTDEACDVCQPYAGQEIDIDDYDDSGEVDAEGAIPLHCNCTCALAEIVDLDKDDDSDE